MDDEEYLQRTLEWNRQSRTKMTEGLKQLGFTVVPSNTNFLFVDLHQPAEPIWNALFEHGIFIRKFEDPAMQTYVRICLGLPVALQRCLDVLGEILNRPAPKTFA